MIVKAGLDLALIKRPKLGGRPIGVNAKGALVFDANVENKSHILLDSNRMHRSDLGSRRAEKTRIIR